MLRQEGCRTVPTLFPGDSITKRTRSVSLFPPGRRRCPSVGTARFSEEQISSGRHQPIHPLPQLPSRDQPRRRPRCVSPTTARCCNTSTVDGASRLHPALPRARSVERGVNRCPDILGVEKHCSPRGFGRDIKTSPIDQEARLPSMSALALIPQTVVIHSTNGLLLRCLWNCFSKWSTRKSMDSCS